MQLMLEFIREVQACVPKLKINKQK